VESRIETYRAGGFFHGPATLEASFWSAIVKDSAGGFYHGPATLEASFWSAIVKDSAGGFYHGPATLEGMHLENRGVLVAGCHSFCLFFHILYNIYSFNHSITFINFIQFIYPSPLAEASLHLLIAWKLSRKNLPVVPSRELNSGLPYSKPTCYQLSHAAP
jgi:hypothetical protein